MARAFESLTGRLAAGAVLAILCMPANAAGLGLGGLGGVSVGGGGTNAGASVGNAATASASTGDSGVNDSVGGPAGANATVGTSGAGTGTGLGVGAAVVTNPAAPGTLGVPGNPSLPGVVVDMSSSQLARMKKRCADVLASESVYDRDLRQLCLLVARR
jgi:hypothetical protein